MTGVDSVARGRGWQIHGEYDADGVALSLSGLSAALLRAPEQVGLSGCLDVDPNSSSAGRMLQPQSSGLSHRVTFTSSQLKPQNQPAPDSLSLLYLRRTPIILIANRQSFPSTHLSPSQYLHIASAVTTFRAGSETVSSHSHRRQRASDIDHHLP